MSYTTADRDKLRAELLDAERVVRRGDYSVQYRPVDEIRAALDIVERHLAAAAAGGPSAPIRQVRLHSEKGL